jgi:Domain of unknown function (DUF4205)
VHNRDGEGEALRVQSRQPGSRLKTPGLPIWVRYQSSFEVVCSSRLSSAFDVGHEYDGTLRHHLQLESRAAEELSRGEALRVAPLHCGWLLRLDGEFAISMRTLERLRDT